MTSEKIINGDKPEEKGEYQYNAVNSLNFISTYVDSISEEVWPVNKTIHENPELCFEEVIAHETLTSFLKAKPGWKVTPSAFGIATAFCRHKPATR